MNIRAIAATALAPVIGQKQSLNTALPRALQNCPDNERALLQQFCYGTMRSLPRLNCIAEHLLKKPFKPQDRDIHDLLLLGIYQLLELRIPEHAAISETVNAAGEMDKGWAKGLLNAILRRVQREQDSLEQQLGDHPEFRFNHPQWMISKLQHNWPDNWQQILEQNNQQPPLTLRVNRQKTAPSDYLAQLESKGIAGHSTPFSDTGIQLEQAVDIKQLPGFTEGLFSVQDEAAQLSSGLLDLHPGQRVLDACAAPGGKLCHILEHQADLDHVTAIELEHNRADKIKENLQRLQLDAELIVADASQDNWWDQNPYDRILVDAPCSATGVIRRNPDIKQLRQSEDIKALAELQLEILTNCWRMLKPGGRLVYATCSIFPQENERLMQRFLKQQQDATHLPIQAEWGTERAYGRQLFPQPQGHDGFYYAVLLKKQN